MLPGPATAPQLDFLWDAFQGLDFSGELQMLVWSENKTSYLDTPLEKHLADVWNCLFPIISTVEQWRK